MLVRMVHTLDEFRFLASDASRVGREKPLPEVRRVTADGTEGRVVSAIHWQPNLAPEFVLLHGAGLNAHSFDQTVLALDAPALSIDLPGHGRSDWRSDAGYTPQLMAPDALRTIETFATQPVTLVGHSLGGLTAAALAELQLEAADAGASEGLIHRLVIIDITPGVVAKQSARSVTEFITGQRDYGSHEEIVDRAIRFGIGSDREALARGVALNTRQRPDGRWEWTHHFAHLDGLPVRGANETPEERWQTLERVHAAGVPVTLVAASDGMVTAEHIDEWRARLPGTEVVTLTGPHNLHEAAPRELAEVLV